MEMTQDKRKQLISSLYNKCSAGEISLEQRELLILKVNSMCEIPDIVTTESAEEPTVETKQETPTTQLSAPEKYKLFKEKAYKKWNEGELTTDQREELLVKARDLYFQ